MIVDSVTIANISAGIEATESRVYILTPLDSDHEPITAAPVRAKGLAEALTKAAELLGGKVRCYPV